MYFDGIGAAESALRDADDCAAKRLVKVSTETTPPLAEPDIAVNQAVDLAEASSIAVYSCYRDAMHPSRRLIVKAKESGVAFEVPLDHGCVVTFSVDTNRRFTHAIVLRANAPDNEWLGLTFRTSKTFVRLVDGHPTLPSGARLTLANEEQRREFFQMRRRENDETSFTYPSISYTLSESDLLPPRS